MGLPSFSDDAILGAVVRGRDLSCPRPVRRIPAWDLFLVLASLRGPPYEPLREVPLKFLTLKTAFLVPLASGRRSSEVHALSGLP